MITAQKLDRNISFMLSRHVEVLSHNDSAASMFPQASICEYLLISHGDGAGHEVPFCLTCREKITPQEELVYLVRNRYIRSKFVTIHSERQIGVT